MKSDLYILPWTHKNNPNGWIEPTTFCQLKCPHCYRGCDRFDHKPEHRKLEDLKLEVDKFIKDRNVETISISGGEPLLYPHLPDLIKFIKSRGLKIMIFTNGILLDEKKLVELADLGVTQIVLHIDKYQSRDSAADQKEINKLKDEYCKLFRRIRRISLGFIEPIYDVSDLEEILIFYKQNKDIVSLIDFTVATETYDAEINKNNHKVNLELVCKKINEIYGVQYSAGMGRFLSDDFTWVCGTLVFSGDNLLGSIDKEVVQFIHESYYKKNKRYIFIGNHYPINFRSILMFFTNKSLRKIAGNYLKQKYKGKIYFQVILTIIPPELGQDKFNICRSCPDAMYYKGKLIPSCLLGRIERGMGENYKYYLEDYE